MQRYYTTVEQSKRLLELGLNPETADMCYLEEIVEGNGCVPWRKSWGKYPVLIGDKPDELVPEPVNLLCWSVGALLDVLDYPKFYKDNTSGKDLWHCRCNINEREIVKVSFAETEIDAVVELVMNLLDFGLLKNKK